MSLFEHRPGGFSAMLAASARRRQDGLAVCAPREPQKGTALR